MDAADYSVGDYGRTDGTGCNLVHGYVERSLDYARDDKRRGGISPPPLLYIPMHEVVPSAVSTAVITDAMICSVHFRVSLFVIKFLLPLIIKF